MKQVWICDWCSFKNGDMYNTQLHEKSCKANPANKLCQSCSNLYDSGPLGYIEQSCKEEHSCVKIMFFKTPCKNWKK